MGLPEAMSTKWYYSVWGVLLLLFFLLGPLGLPFLWKSPRFPLWAKAALTILVVSYSGWLIMQLMALARAGLSQTEQLRLLFP